MNKNQEVKNDDLLFKIDGLENVNLDTLDKEYINATGKIFNQVKYEIKNYDEIQKNNRIVLRLHADGFNAFVSTLRTLKIQLPPNVDEKYFQDHAKEVMNQIEKINMSEEYRTLLQDKCRYYHNPKNVPQENKIESNDLDFMRKYIDNENFFTQRFRCLMLICKNEMYSKIHDGAKKLLEQVVNDLKKNELMFNNKIENKINKDMIEKYDSVTLAFYENNESKINKIILETAKIKNENEVKTILKKLEEQDKIKEEEERKKKEDQKKQNNEFKDESKTEKDDTKKEKNSSEKTNKENNQANITIQNKTDDNKNLESNLKFSSKQENKNNENKNNSLEINLKQQKEIEKQKQQKRQRIREVAESSYFHEILWRSFCRYYNSDTKKSLEQADVYQEFRNLSMDFANSIKIKCKTDSGLTVVENFQSEEINTLLVEYLLDDKFYQFEFEAKPRQYTNDQGYNLPHTTDDTIRYFADGRVADIFKKSMPLIFDRHDYQKIAGAVDGPSESNDCFILSLLSHLSLQELEEIKKFVDKNKIRKLYIKNGKVKIKEQTYDLFKVAGGNNCSISDKAKIIAYMRAALAIKIVDNWHGFPYGDPNHNLNIEDWEEFLTLLAQGPFKDDDNRITKYGRRQISGESHLIAQAVVDLTKRPYLLIYQSDVGQTGYFLATTDHVSYNETKKYNGVEIGDIMFGTIYSTYVKEQGLDAQQSKCIEKSNELLTELNGKLLKLIDDPNVISIKLNSSGDPETRKTSGHFWAIGRNYMGETLTTQKNNDVFNKFNVERDLKSNSDLRTTLNQLGFTEENKNIPSCYFLANRENFQRLQDISDFLQMLDPENIKANFDKWFKNLICTDDGRIDEDNFTDQVNKLFYSQNSQDKNKKLYKDNNKVVYWREVINNFSSYVPSHFHSKWFQTVHQLWPNPILFYKNTVIDKLEKIKLENDNGMKYFGYLIGKFVEFVADSQNADAAYETWKNKFIDGVENILTYKNHIENNFLSEVKTEKFVAHDDPDVVNNLSKFSRLFDPDNLYLLIDVVEKGKDCDALKPLYNLSPKAVNKFCDLFRKFVEQKGKNQNEIKKEEDKKENKNDNIIRKQDNVYDARANLIKLLGEINSQNPNNILDKIISDSGSFEQLNDSLKTIKSIVNNGEDAKNFLFNLDFQSFKKVLVYFKQEQVKEKNQNENEKEEEKKEDKQKSFWEFIKDKKYNRDDIQKIVSVSNSFDEIKNNIKSLDDTLKIDQCKTCQQKNKTGFWDLFTNIRNSISKIFSLFKNNWEQDVQDKQSLEYIASALNRDDDKGENARIMFYTVSKNMGSKEREKLWTKVSKYMGKKKNESEESKGNEIR